MIAPTLKLAAASQAAVGPSGSDRLVGGTGIASSTCSRTALTMPSRSVCAASGLKLNASDRPIVTRLITSSLPSRRTQFTRSIGTFCGSSDIWTFRPQEGPEILVQLASGANPAGTHTSPVAAPTLATEAAE